MTEYLAFVFKNDEGGYSVDFPDFQGCVTVGNTLEEARINAQGALAVHIEGMAEDGDMIPKPMTLDEAVKDPYYQNAAIVYAVRRP